MRTSRIQKRVYELLSKAATSSPVSPTTGQRELHFVFFRKPDRFLESEKRNGKVAAVHFEKTTLKGSFFLYSPSISMLIMLTLSFLAHPFCAIRHNIFIVFNYCVL